MRFVKHIFIVIISLFVILGIPFMCTDYFKAWASGQTDALSSATVVLDQPSGEYVVLINTDRHTDEEALQTWVDFFEGKEIPVIFEDISCKVAKGDANGLEMAQSYQSRLPENQMLVEVEDGILMLSKAEYGKFDIIVMSKEMADSYTASTLFGEDTVRVIEVH